MNELIDKLKENPNAKASELPYEDWAGFAQLKMRGKVLSDDRPFLEAVLEAMEDADIYGEGCNWDPYDEGYDDGPGNVRDFWRKGYYVSTGQWSGYVLEVPAIDALHAELLYRVQNMAEGVGEAPKPEEVMEELNEWQGPRSQEDKDEDYINQIRALYSELSNDGKVLCKETLDD